MADRGRPTDLTPEVLEDIEELLPICLYIETVADFLGISRMTIRRWVKRGGAEQKRRRRGRKPRQSEEIFIDFCYALKKGVAQGDVDDLTTIKSASATQWQAAAWRQERRHRDKWGSDKAEVRSLRKEVAELKAMLIGCNNQRTSPGSGETETGNRVQGDTPG